ncbi:MAG: sodium:solute symporter [Bacteroidales bacterium]|nr:sodium:solute symporter [Bacteroidales bacterium]MDD3431004.1 sodium:solute symporter [Bacteroidales bacterium]MDD4360980.1 sodium:solute symporter [Bacteroidales bacterium]MDD4430000.1 sodium:solute symporter [Bacteroidales bacterium]
MNNIHWIDLGIVLISVLLTVFVGIYFAKRQSSSDNYFAGSKKIPSWAIGLSIFATLISSVTFLAYPAAAYKGNWILLVQGMMVPIVLVFLIWLIVPLFRKMIRLSTYEYFERRFGFLARIYSSLAFILTHFSKMGTVLYLISLALYSMTGIDVIWIIWALGITIVLLTLFGGMEGVIWMDVIQGVLLIGGGLLCAGILIFRPEGGAISVFTEAITTKKIGFGPYNFSFAQLTFWVMVINGVFYALQKYGTDQTIVQRYLTAKSDKEAKKAAYIGVGLSVPVWALFMLIGSALYIFYNSGTAVLPEGINADQVFPHFIINELPVGITGLVIAALVAAAISSLDSDMNCLAAIGVEDYYQRMKPNCSDKQRLNAGRILVAVSGLASIGVASLYAVWEGEGVLGVVFELYAIFSAGIVGIFLLGLFSKRANKQGLYIGLLVCVLFTAYAVLTSTSIEVGGSKRLILDLGSLNFPHHKYMLGVYSHLIVLIVGYVASLFFPKPQLENGLTIFDYKKQKLATSK